MAYIRPTMVKRLTKPERIEMLRHYMQEYQMLLNTTPEALNQKLPRKHLSILLNKFGGILLSESKKMAASGPVREFLDGNPLPASVCKYLPNDVRAFYLVLNALKQWVSAEQGAMDRYLLGGKARSLCREATEKCLITGNPTSKDFELHHPVRDGRPPIYISKEAHAKIEGQQRRSSE